MVLGFAVRVSAVTQGDIDGVKSEAVIVSLLQLPAVKRPGQPCGSGAAGADTRRLRSHAGRCAASSRLQIILVDTRDRAIDTRRPAIGSVADADRPARALRHAFVPPAIAIGGMGTDESAHGIDRCGRPACQSRQIAVPLAVDTLQEQPVVAHACFTIQIDTAVWSVERAAAHNTIFRAAQMMP